MKYTFKDLLDLGLWKTLEILKILSPEDKQEILNSITTEEMREINRQRLSGSLYESMKRTP